ncbi:MAG TPA: hypothetical protein VFW89_08055 [Gemmatimonadaceae bacterium]|nr:hypothetical protein [Gemmatimonadaceae bacterium]
MDRREFGRWIGAAIVTRSLQQPSTIARRMHPHSETQPTVVAGIRLVDSAIAKQAEHFARAAYEPYLFNHAMRTFLFGSLIGKAMKLEWDEELVFLAAIMHDLGLTARHMGPLPFELSGAQAARAFLHAQGMATERANVVWDGIALHPTMVAEFKQPEIALIAAGAAADVTGSGLDAVSADSRAAVLHYAPRLGFKQAFVHSCADVVRRYPRAASRSFMRDIGERYVPGFSEPNICDAIAHAPFDESPS